MATYKFGVRDGKIAPWTTTGSYGTLIDVNAINEVEVTVETTNAQLEGDDVIADTHAVNRSVMVRVRFGLGAQTLDVINALTGATLTSSTSTYRRAKIAADNAVYIGFCAQVYETSGAGDNFLWVPKCKLMEGLSYRAAYGGYVISDLNLTGIVDSTAGMFDIIEHTTATAITVFPPI